MTEKNEQFGFGGIQKMLLNAWWGRGRDLNPGERLAASTQTELGPQASMLPSYITPATVLL